MSEPPHSHPQYIPIPPHHLNMAAPTPLRSAMKHGSSSRPTTPNPGSTPVSPSILPRNSTFSSLSGMSTGPNTPFSPGSFTTTPSPTLSSLPLPSSPFLTATSFPNSSQHTPSIYAPPPLLNGYTPKVSFDTFEDPSSSMFSYTLRVKSDGYEKTKGTRVFLCAASNDESGVQALEWACESLVQDGDELIVLRGIGEEELQKDHDLVREDARDLMRQLQEKCQEYDPDRKLSLIVEFIAGRITTTIDRLIALYRPDALVVGTRGQRGLVAWGGLIGGSGGGVGSVSKYCLSHSPVPIIVVRPESKVRKAREKRRADPKRGRHFDGLPTTPIPLSPAPTRS